MPEVVVFIGFQGAGKSTFYVRHFAETHVLVSKDRLKNNRWPERRQQRLIAEALGAGRSVAVDNTNPSAAERASIIATSRSHGARIVGYFFTSPLAECLARNAARPAPARIPEAGLFATAKRLVRPAGAEGFDDLWCVRTLSDFQFEVTHYQEDARDEPR